jgi:hypothetical protein
MTVEPELKRVKRLLRFRTELGEQLGAGLGELHKRTALVLPASRAIASLDPAVYSASVPRSL